MSLAGSPWPEALAALLDALGVQATAPAPRPRDIDRALDGLGLSARRHRLDAGGLPEGPIEGALIEMAAGDWLPVVPTETGGIEAILAAERSRHPVTAIDGHAGRAVVLTRHTDDLREILPFLRRHKGRLADILAAGLIANSLALLFPLFGSFVYDKVLGNGITETLWALAIGLFLAIGIDFAVRTLRQQAFERFAVASERDIDRSLFAGLLNGRRAAAPPVGLVLDRYKQILGARDFLAGGYLLAALDLPFLLLFLLALAYIAGPLCLVPLAIGAGMMGLQALLAIPAHEYEIDARRAGERRFSLLADVLTAHEAILGERIRVALSQRWSRASIEASAATSFSRYWHALSGQTSWAASNLAYVLALIAGAYMIEDRTLTSGGLIATTILTSRAIATMASLVLLVVRYREFRSALRGLDALFPRHEPPPPAPRRDRVTGRVHLSGIGARLRPGGRPTLDGIDLRIEPGQAVALVGRPGAGKTTLLRLIAGLLIAHDGEVTIDGIPVDRWAPADLDRLLGYKPQEPALFEGSLEACVLAGRPGQGGDALIQALLLAGLGPSLDRGELTLATEIGPRGTHLSGGQRQMVALARALFGLPPLLLLDEPTTGLDGPLERHLAKGLERLKGRHTLIVSTHSRDLLTLCDRIVVIDQGKIVADGPPERILGQ